MMQDMIAITLAYAPTAEQQFYRRLTVPKGSTIFEALVASGWLQQFPELDQWCQVSKEIKEPNAKAWHVGIYSHKKPLSYVLQPDDRIEVYRSLHIDPMGKRKRRAIQKNTIKKAP